MIERTCTHQLGVGSNLVGYGYTEVAHHDGMLEGAGSCLAELLQQILTRVRQLDECHIGGESEGLLDEIHERISEEQ